MLLSLLLQPCWSFVGPNKIIVSAANRQHVRRSSISQLVLSPQEQFAEQQRQQREARQRRLEAEAEAENGGPAEDPEAAARKVQYQADIASFQQQYSRQLALFNQDLFPPEQYSARNGLSRKDGYWAFVGKGEDPPLDFTYGEFPLQLFSKLVDRACELLAATKSGASGALFGDRSSITMADLGSGAGRLALWAASTSAYKRVMGVEYLTSLASDASEKLTLARGLPGLLQTPDVQLVEGSWDDPDALSWSEIDLAFAYTTAITTNDDGILEGLSEALSRRLPRGCIVVTTDYKLDPAGFDVLESLEGQNDGVGGVSTGFIHVKTCAGERDELTEEEAKCPFLNQDLSSADSSPHLAAPQESPPRNAPGAEQPTQPVQPTQPTQPTQPAPVPVPVAQQAEAGAFHAMESVLLGDLKKSFEEQEAEMEAELRLALDHDGGLSS